MVSKIRILESKKTVSVNRDEKVVSDESVLGLGVGLLSSGLQDVMWHTKDNDGLAEINKSLDQVNELQLFQSGPKMPNANERGFIRKAKSPNQKKKKASHTCMQPQK